MNAWTPQSVALREGEHSDRVLGDLLREAGLPDGEAQALKRRARVPTLRCELRELAERQRREIASVLEARAHLDEPLHVEPFLRWCDEREARLRMEHEDAHARLVTDLGWDHDAGARRLARWRGPTNGDGDSGYAERAVIEDALHHAGGDFDDVYPDARPPRRVVVRLGQKRRMTDAEVIAAHTIYFRQNLYIVELAELIWERYGYASVESCAGALRTAWLTLGLPFARRAEVTRRRHTKHGLLGGVPRGYRPAAYKAMEQEKRRAVLGVCQHPRPDGTPCGYTCQPGSDACGYHDPEKHAARVARLLANRWRGPADPRTNRQDAAA